MTVYKTIRRATICLETVLLCSREYKSFYKSDTTPGYLTIAPSLLQLPRFNFSVPDYTASHCD